MFSGAGDFFRPVDLRKEVSPAAVVKPVSSGGEEFQKHTSGTPQKDDGEAGAPDGGLAPDGFSDDAISLSLPALFMMLTGAPPSALQPETPDKTDAGLRGALGAYHRAAETLPGAPPPHPASGDLRTERGAAMGPGAEIFQMLAALEKAGVAAVNVRGGQTIYDALRAQCRAYDIALAVPPVSPDNAI
jgi:hypothetical protein